MTIVDLWEQAKNSDVEIKKLLDQRKYIVQNIPITEESKLQVKGLNNQISEMQYMRSQLESKIENLLEVQKLLAQRRELMYYKIITKINKIKIAKLTREIKEKIIS